ncbi:DUF262 domain-containing protein [Luteibacter sp.]|uniref:DUF262 domain-containing protein n=1 Tax=Luteibacter sp. TaxID=1886636 RepID=UPI003F7EEC95
MVDALRLTNSSDETELALLLSGDLVFSIPYFQRAYKWKPEKLRQLEEDLLSIIDAEGTHFLGAIIVYARRSNPADPNIYEIVDGQQRTTTVFIYLCAIVKTLCDSQLYDEAAGLLLKYLVVGIGRDARLLSNSKLHCCKEDRSQLNRVFAHILADLGFAAHISPFRYKPLPSTGAPSGRLWNNYRQAVRFLAEQVRLEGTERLRAIYSSLLNAVSVVQIVVRNPVDGPKIFDSLNSRQEPITTGDLVRNEIFAKVANEDPDVIEGIDHGFWQPFYTRFTEGDHSLFDAYFFPYGLIQDPNVRKAEVFEKLRNQWKNSTPEEIINQLSNYQNAFLDAVRGSNLQQHSSTVAAAFKRLHDANAPGSTYPFIMQLSNAVKAGQVSEGVCVEVLLLVESFLVRRALCGHEPTGLHAVFKRLWQDVDMSPTREKVEASIRRHKTVVWPADDDVTQAIKTRPLYDVSVTRYVLHEWNRSLGGDQPIVETWIEHVLPVSPSADWNEHFSQDDHAATHDLLANLLLLSKEMNRDLSNAGYGTKRPVFAEDSVFKATRKFAEGHLEWTPENLRRRSETLANWAVSRWPSR